MILSLQIPLASICHKQPFCCWTPARWLHSSTIRRCELTDVLLQNCSCCCTKNSKDKLQPMLNSAARVVTGTWKFDCSLGQILHDELQWLDVPDRVFSSWQ